MLRNRLVVLGLLCPSLLVITGCAPGASGSSLAPPTATQIGAQGPVLPNPGNPPISKQQQIQAGLQAAQQVYQQMPVLPDSSPVTQYVRALGNRLAAQIPQQYSWPFQFHVVAEKDINAFALPGGQMFVNLGAITAADNAAELAGVMAHEMSHVYLQHAAKMAVQQQQTQGIAAVGAGILGAILGNGAAGNIANAAIGIGANLYELRYSRGDEAQADATGAIIMYKAGYNPRAMAQFFQKIEQQGGPGAPQFLSDHPNPGNRVAAVDQEVAEWPAKNFTNNTQNFIAARRNAQGVRAYSAQQIQQQAQSGYWARMNQQDGAVFNPNGTGAPTATPAGQAPNQAGPSTMGNISYSQVAPRGGMQSFQGSVFTLSYPANWQASSDQNGGATIAPAAGASGGSVAYGVVIGGTSQNVGALSQATQSLVQSLQQSNPGMNVASQPSSLNVAGQQGESLMLRSNSPITLNGQPLAETDWLVTVARPQGGLLYMIFIAPQRDFGRLRSTYQTMLNSLQVR